MDEIWSKIQSAAESESGIITTKQIESMGVSRTVLKKYVDDNRLIRVRKGLYTLSDSFSDEYLLLQARSGKTVFSYGTALFLWGLSDRAPHYIDMTVPQGANISNLKRDNPRIRFHYIQEPLYAIGITETVSPQGGVVRLYDKERCLCDLIRDKKDMDMQLYTQAVKEYFRSSANGRKLLKYGKQFGVEEQIRNYMEVLL